MCQSRAITWNTRKYREISQNLCTLAIMFKILWQNFTKSSGSLVIHEKSILCKYQEVSMCPSRDITWNTRKYREISQNLRTLAIIFKILWQNFTKTSGSLVIHKMSILCKNQEVSMCQSRDITWNARKYNRGISQNLHTLAIFFKILWQNFTKTSGSFQNFLTKFYQNFRITSNTWDEQTVWKSGSFYVPKSRYHLKHKEISWN